MSGIAARWRELLRSCGGPAGFFGACVIALFLAVALGAPLIAPHDPLAVSIADQLQEPGKGHWLGTDQSGRDVLSRIIWGSRASLTVSALAVLIGLAGVPIGLVAGFFRGGWLEQAIMRVLEAIAAIPILIWAIALVGIFGVKDVAFGPLTITNETKLLVMLGLLYIPTLARLTYTSALSESQ